MTDAEKKAMLTAMTTESNDVVLSTYLALAGNKICRKAYPYDSSVVEVPPVYDFLHVEIAAYLLNKRGAEGEISHSENGISRQYEDGDIPTSLMRQITPFAVPLFSPEDSEEGSDTDEEDAYEDDGT